MLSRSQIEEMLGRDHDDRDDIISRACRRRDGVGVNRRGGGFRGFGGSSREDLIQLDNAIALNGSESFGTNAGGDLVECAYAAAFGPQITLTAWGFFRVNVHRDSRGIIGQMDYGSQRRWVLTSGFSGATARRVTIFFFNSGSDATAWSLTSTNDILPAAAGGGNILVMVRLKMDEAVAGDRAVVDVLDMDTGIWSTATWGAPGGTPGTTLTSNTAKLTAGSWNSRPGINAWTTYARAWGFHNVKLTDDERNALGRRQLVARGLIDWFLPPHTDATTFAGKILGTVATLKGSAAGKEPKILRTSPIPPLLRATTIGPSTSSTVTRLPANGQKHYGVSGKKVGDGTSPASGTMNFTAVADAASLIPVDGLYTFIFFEGGTNDIALDAVTGAQMIERNKQLIRNYCGGDKDNRIVFWSSIPPSRTGAQQTVITDHNNGMAAAITALATEDYVVHLVDRASVFDSSNDYVDANHWGAAGYNKGARKWWSEAKSVMDAVLAPGELCRVLFLGDSHTLGSQWNEFGTPANECGYRGELVAMMRRDGY